MEKHKKGKDPVSDAHDQAEKDMMKDPDMNEEDPANDLDEGELARRDNSDEDALDSLDRPRHQGSSSSDTHSDHTVHPTRANQSGKGK